MSPLPDTRLAVRADAGCASPPRATGDDHIYGPAACRDSTLCAVFIGHQERKRRCTAATRNDATCADFWGLHGAGWLDGGPADCGGVLRAKNLPLQELGGRGGGRGGGGGRVGGRHSGHPTTGARRGPPPPLLAFVGGNQLPAPIYDTST